jgi:two-component system, LytTR family, sensor kinase
MRETPQHATAADRGLSFWPMVAIAGGFWAYATISAVLYAYGLGTALVITGQESIFAPWHIRVMLYGVLFAPLVACYWYSLRIGWRPWWRTVPLQLVLAIAFAVLARLVLFGLSLLDNFAADGRPDLEVILARLVDDVPAVGLATITDFFVRYGFGLALVTGAALYKQVRDSQLRAAALERLWSSARLQALRMQLSPHALFNLLGLIKGEIAHNPDTAQKLIVQLGDLLRRLLNAGDRDFARLSDELEFVALYLKLQQQRFPERLALALPDPCELPDVWVPSLILQPLVENAVRHGLAGHEGRNTVALEVAAHADELTVSVRNDAPDGAGEAEERVGLRNVRERLAVHFGERGRLAVGPTTNGRWAAEVRMPLLHDQPAAI